MTSNYKNRVGTFIKKMIMDSDPHAESYHITSDDILHGRNMTLKNNNTISIIRSPPYSYLPSSMGPVTANRKESQGVSVRNMINHSAIKGDRSAVKHSHNEDYNTEGTDKLKTLTPMSGSVFTTTRIPRHQSSI